MSDGGRQQAPAAAGNRLVALGAALGVVLLAAAATWWPRAAERPESPLVAVLDPSGDEWRHDATWPALAAVLAAPGGDLPRVVVARTSGELREVAPAADFVVCPDGVALGLDAAAWAPLVAGRRAAPRNLRPRGVLVSRRGREAPEPWRTEPGAVIFGDSLGLAATGPLRPAGAGAAMPRAAGWGPDPWDHSPALHALRLGAFAHAVVRQWDADRFRAQGLLPDSDWTFTEVTVPVPDLVVMATRRLAAPARLELGERLVGIGRDLSDPAPAERELAAALPALGLAGFNLLVDPDLELVRGHFAGDWPPARP